MGAAKVLEIPQKYEAVECCACGMAFAMSAVFQRRMLETGGSFYCPQGHRQVYTVTKVQKLEKQLSEMERNRDYYRDRNQENKELAAHQKRSKAAYKAHLTRAKQRFAHGVCPCCKRTFQDVARHMESKHPDYGRLAEGQGGEKA